MSKTDGRIPNQHGLAIKVILVLILVAGLVFWVGQWLHYRLTHVHVVDARVTTDMVSVASRLPGWVSQLQVMEGDQVEKGQVLAEVNSTAARLELDVLEAGRQALKGERAQIEAELNLMVAVDDNRVIMAQKELDTATVLVEQQALSLTKANEDLTRLQGMTNAMVSAQQLANLRYLTDNARVALRLGEAERASAQAVLADAEAQKLKQKVLARQLDAVDARLQELSAKYRRRQLDVEDRHIRSPITGVVARTFIDAGEYVQPGQNLLMVHAVEDIWIEANVKETALAKVVQGQHVSIAVDAYPGTGFSGRVERIGSAATSEFALLPSPNPSGNFTKTTQRIPLRIALENPPGSDSADHRLRPGMMVEVSIDVVD
jgi:membrane fusion protein (multidrug efflux system)